MANFTLSAINIYPVKSLAGISLTSSKVEERGLEFDRRWMIVDSENIFITQRKTPQMVFINIKIEDQKLIFQHRIKKMDQLEISLFEIPEKIISVKIWEDICKAVEYKNEINDWFSEALDINCKLVYMPNSTARKTSIKYYQQSKNVSFADGYPFLIIGEETLNFLNSKLVSPVMMKQFRPNLVFAGGKEHDEDNWKNIKIGQLMFTVVKPCARCVITTIDPVSSKKGKEPLATLSKYRNVENKILFGQNALVHQEGFITIGDKIKLEQA